MLAKVIKPSSDEEFFIAEGCHIIEIANDASDPASSIAQARVEPGVTTRWHQLKHTVERYYILSGQGLVDVGDLKGQQVGSGDCVVIPSDTPQRISNVGVDDLLFLAICSPRFLPENYIDLEDQFKS